MKLTRDEKIWIKLKWRKIRESQVEADKADADWKDINRALNVKLDREGIDDIVQRTKIKGESIPLKDALGNGTWHARNAERHIHDLQVFLKLKELDLL